jgi:hypothetical protein
MHKTCCIIFFLFSSTFKYIYHFYINWGVTISEIDEKGVPLLLRLQCRTQTWQENFNSMHYPLIFIGNVEFNGHEFQMILFR